MRTFFPQLHRKIWLWKDVDKGIRLPDGGAVRTTHLKDRYVKTNNIEHNSIGIDVKSDRSVYEAGDMMV